MSLNPLRNLPSVNDLIDSPPLRRLLGWLSRGTVVSAAQALLDETRREALHAAAEMTLPDVADLAERVARRVLESQLPALRSVINATGELFHPGLGRAPLADEAIEEMGLIARGYASVDLDLQSGRRRARSEPVEGLLVRLTGAEAALVVNNQTAAMLLALAAHAAGREVVVARGQIVETEDGYRLPDIVSAAGAVLREVGTTNQTTLDDYRAALGPACGAILAVEPIGYKVVGRVAGVPPDRLAALARQHRVPLIESAGYVAAIDLAPFGLPAVPRWSAVVARGADLVLASGDKLLGGPQCGVILGRRAAIDQLAAHPIARAARCGAPVLAALAATLRLQENPETARRAVPILQLITTSAENLRCRAERMAPQLAAARMIASAEVQSGETPLDPAGVAGRLPTCRIVLRGTDQPAERLAARLRAGAPSILAGVADDRVVLDLRTVLPRQDLEIVEAVENLGGTPGEKNAGAADLSG